MSHKHVGPIGWEFSGDKTRCVQLIGPARLLAQRALEKISARGGSGQQMELQRFGDGSTVRVQVICNVGTPLIRAYVYAPGADARSFAEGCFESGLLFSALVPPRVYAGDDLYAEFSKIPSWQGCFKQPFDKSCLEWNAWSGGTSYLSKIYADGFKITQRDVYDPSVRSFLHPASCTGLLRLAVQAKYGAGIDPATLFIANGKYGVTLDGRYHGIVQYQNTYWMCYIHSSVGLRMYELALPTACPGGGILKDAFIFAGLVPRRRVVNGVETYNEIQALPPESISKLPGGPCGHGWHWNRMKPEASIALVQSFDSDAGIDGLDCSIGRVYTVEITFSMVGENGVIPEARVFLQKEGSKVRFFHGRVPLWYPLHELRKYVAVITSPPYTYNMFYAPFRGGSTPVYVYYSDKGELSILEYQQYYLESDDLDEYDADCYSDSATTASGGIVIFTGGWTLTGSPGANDRSAWLLGHVDIRNISRSGSGGFTRKGSALPDGLSKLWAIGGGGVYSPELEEFASDLGPGNQYWGVAQNISYGTIVQKQRFFAGRNQVSRRCAIIPYTDAECVILFSQDEAHAETLTESEFILTSNGPFKYAISGEFIKYYDGGRVSSGSISAAYYNGLGGCDYVTRFGGADYGFVPGWHVDDGNSEYSEVVTTSWSAIECKLLVVSSTTIVSKPAGIDDIGAFLYPGESNFLIDIVMDAHFAYNFGGGFSDTMWSYDGVGGYPPSQPQFSSFIGGA